MKLLFAILLCPLLLTAQDRNPKFENDTLYTSSGYKIFSGTTIEFAKGLERYNRFKYVSVKNGILSLTTAILFLMVT
jgi:hypothetical protein